MITQQDMKLMVESVKDTAFYQGLSEASNAEISHRIMDVVWKQEVMFSYRSVLLITAMERLEKAKNGNPDNKG